MPHEGARRCTVFQPVARRRAQRLALQGDKDIDTQIALQIARIVQKNDGVVAADLARARPASRKMRGASPRQQQADSA